MRAFLKDIAASSSIAVVAAFIGLTAAFGQSSKDCDNPVDAPDVAIAACSGIINQASKKSSTASAYNNRGLAWYMKLDYDRALADYDRAIGLDPKLSVAYRNRGNTWSKKGNYDQAIRDFNTAIGLEPGNALYWSNRGSVWRQKGEFDRAISDQTQSYRLDPRSSQALRNRSLVWRDKGDFRRALADLDDAIRLSGSDVTLYALRGEVWRLLGDLDRSLVDLNVAIRERPGNALYLSLRGDARRFKGELDRAREDFDAAISASSEFAAAFVGRGLTFERMGNLARAKADFEMALTFSPIRYDTSREALETARARLAALASGQAQPVIPAAPARVTGPTSIPTGAIQKSVVEGRASAVAPVQGRRVALVIGNSAYTKVQALDNPQKDADAIAASLRSIGFEVVTLAANVSREILIERLRSFADEADTADWALIYYAGHGIEVNGMNYLIPVDAALKTDRDIQFEAVSLDQVMAAIEGAKRLKLVVLDACRDNPFKPYVRNVEAAASARPAAVSRPGTRSIGRGLGEVKVQGASLVVFAARHGQTALDGEGANSPFAVAMVQRIATPGVEINKIFRLVRDDVMEATAGRQEPYTYGSLPGKEDFYFVAK